MSTPIFLAKTTIFFTQVKNWVFTVFVPEENNKYLPGALKPKLLFCYSSILLLIKIATISFVLILPYSNFFSAITQNRLISLVNQARQNNNLSPVSLNKTLNETADLKINDMLANDYFEHTSPSGITPWSWFKKAGYNYAYAGENLAINFTQTDDVFSAWMASPAHRDNILNPNFNEIGLAVKNGPLQNHDATLAVLVFGKQQAVKNSQAVASQSQGTTPKAPSLIKPSAAPKTASNPTPVAPKLLNTPAPTIKAAPTPTQSLLATPAISVSVSPSAPETQNIVRIENIELQSITGGTAGNLGINSGQTKTPDNLSLTSNKWTPRVLGAFASKIDEVTKSLYLYFTLFLTLALIVNIFIKIEVQYWRTIFATILVILLSSTLIFI